jgi:hypothetical protein
MSLLALLGVLPKPRLDIDPLERIPSQAFRVFDEGAFDYYPETLT